MNRERSFRRVRARISSRSLLDFVMTPLEALNLECLFTFLTDTSSRCQTSSACLIIFLCKYFSLLQNSFPCTNPACLLILSTSAVLDLIPREELFRKHFRAVSSWSLPSPTLFPVPRLEKLVTSSRRSFGIHPGIPRPESSRQQSSDCFPTSDS